MAHHVLAVSAGVAAAKSTQRAGGSPAAVMNAAADTATAVVIANGGSASEAATAAKFATKKGKRSSKFTLCVCTVKFAVPMKGQNELDKTLLR